MLSFLLGIKIYSQQIYRQMHQCEYCNYETQDRSNFWRHNRSKRHEKNVERAKEKIRRERLDASSNTKNEDNSCPYCEKKFYKAFNLRRHLENNSCRSVTEIAETNRQLRERLLMRELEYEIDRLKTQLYCEKKVNKEKTAFIMSGKAAPTYKTYNISIKNYAEQMYPNAPALESIDPEELKLLGHEGAPKCLVEVLVYYHEQKCLHRYLGDYIIKHYKTEDPAEQSVWTSDTARLTYLVKELIANNKTCWIADKKGVKTREKIVKPVLDHVKERIKEYTIDQSKKATELGEEGELNKQMKIFEKLGAASKIQTLIENEILADDMIRYMAPYFYMNREDEEEEEVVPLMQIEE